MSRPSLIALIFRQSGKVVPADLPADVLFSVADAVRRNAEECPAKGTPEIPERQLWPLGRKATVFLLGLN